MYKQHDDPFSFEIIRPGNQHSSEPVWNTTGTRLIYKEQYLEITSWAPRASTMYGLGERISTSGERPESIALRMTCRYSAIASRTNWASFPVRCGQAVSLHSLPSCCQR